MSEVNKNKITQIIKALLAKAAGTDNEHEAGVFAAKAQEMMERYQVEVLDILADDPVDMTVAFEGRADGPARYKSRLSSAVGAYFGCRTVFSTRGTRLTVKLIGRESSRITAELMFPFIYDQCKAAAKRISVETGVKADICERDVINAMISRLARLTREQKPVEPSTVAGKNSLIVVDAIKAKMEELFPDIKDGRAASFSTSSMARKAAEDISLHRQTTGGDTKRLK